MLRGLRWGELRAGGTTVDQTLLAAPPSEFRQNLKRLGLEANWTELLETAETVMGMECGRGWLDLQRYVARACHELGSYYDPIRTAVISGVRALLADYPQLPELTMMDDTATATPKPTGGSKRTCCRLLPASPPTPPRDSSRRVAPNRERPRLPIPSSSPCSGAFRPRAGRASRC